MKLLSSILCVCVLALFSSNAHAQIPTEKTKNSLWKIEKIGTSLGIHGDHYFKMNLKDLESRVNDANYVRADMSNYSESQYSVSSAGVMFNVALSAVKIDRPKAAFSKYSAIEGGIAVHGGREIMVDFYDESTMNDYGYYNSNITYCDMQNEVSLTGAYKRGVSFFNIIRLYTGIGGTLGSTFSSKMLIFSNEYSQEEGEEGVFTQQTYNVKESMITRAYVPFGGELILFDRLNFNAEMRMGTGYQYTMGRDGFGNVNFSLMGGLAYHF